MESVLYSLWRINVKNLVLNKLYICKEYHIQPSEIDRLVFFEYEYMMDEIKVIQKQQEKQREAEDKQYANMQKNMNPASMASQYKPNMGSFNPGSFNMPSISVPKFN